MRASRILQQALSDGLVGIHKQRQQAVFRAVQGLVAGGRLWLSGLGRALPGACHDKHRIKAVDRLIGNPALHRELPVFYGALFRRLCRRNNRPVLFVDWTGVGARRCAITAALCFQGRALPILSHVHPASDAHARHAHREFIASLAALVPHDCTPTLVTDAGFHSNWFCEVTKRGWNFVGRIRGSSSVLADGQWIHVKQLHQVAGACAQDLGTLSIYRGHPEQHRFVLAKKPELKGRNRITRRGHKGRSKIDMTCAKGAREPWLLATSLEVPADAVVAVYAGRMQIEQAYRDFKNHRHGWSLDHVRSRSAQRIEVLLMIAALANVAAQLAGLAAERLGLQRHFQANTTRTRRVLSLFTLGRLVRNSEALTPEALRLALHDLGQILSTSYALPR